MSYDGPANINPMGDETTISAYGYTPNRGFNIFAAVVWGLVLVAHIWWLVKKRTRGIQGLIVMGCIWELIGYAIRAHSHQNPFRPTLFIAQYVILHIAPWFFIMALINAIGWGMRGTDNASVYERFRPRTLTMVLEALSFIAFILISIGSAMFARAVTRAARLVDEGYNREATRKVLIAGHAVKIATLLAISAVLTHLFLHFKRDSVRTTRHGHDSTTINTTGHTTTTTGTHAHDANAAHNTPVDQAPGSALTGFAITKLFLGISWLTAGMLLMRTCYRLAETAQGPFRRAWNSQVLFGLFEFALTWAVVAIWAARPFATQLGAGGIRHGVDRHGVDGTHSAKAHV